MRIYTRAGDLAFKTFTFPDGQPHFKLETYETEFRSVVIETALRSPTDLFLVGQAVSVLRASGYSEINLDIRYLVGARMDRAIDSFQPCTLDLVARTINSYGLSKVRILDVHSDVATRLIRNSENVLPYNVVELVARSCGNGTATMVVPDKGARDRCSKFFESVEGITRAVYCSKERDMATGNLTGFKVGNPENILGPCLILDDICDGGGTFVGLAKELRKAGAKKVYLYVTHGIFSKGLPLEGIDRVFTTDSFYPNPVFVPMQKVDLTIIPIRMKEIK